MTSVLLVVFGVCVVYQVYRFRKAGMPQFGLAYSIAVALMLGGVVFHWPDEVRFLVTVVATGLLLVGSYQLQKYPSRGTPKSERPPV